MLVNGDHNNGKKKLSSFSQVILSQKVQYLVFNFLYKQLMRNVSVGYSKFEGNIFCYAVSSNVEIFFCCPDP